MVLTDEELCRVAAMIGASDVQQSVITAGKSNVTLKLTSEDGVWVLRMPPRHGRTPSAHDVAREYRVVRALADTDVPVPTPVLLCEDAEVLGGPFAVCEFVPGTCLQRRSELEALDDATVAAIADVLAATLAALHCVDHVAVGLERFGRPDGYAERQLARWSGQWELVRPGDDDLDRAAAALAAELAGVLPRQRATGIVHGDYRVDNTLLRLEGEPEVAAVVDWELSTIGDPVADVAMMCGYRHPALDQVLATKAAWASDRLPEPALLAEAYEKAGGVQLVDFERHLALAYFKTAVISAGIDHRNRMAGEAGDPGVTAGQAVGPLLLAGLAALRGEL